MTPYARLIDLGDDVLLLKCAYSAEMIADFKRRIPPPGRCWDATARGWRVGVQYGQMVADLCTAYLGVTPAIPTVTVSATPSPRETRLLEVRYLGKARDRGGGEWTASGWVRSPQPWLPVTERGRGGWELRVTLQALRRFFEPSYALRDPGDDEEQAGPAPTVATAPTLYDVLGVVQDADEAALKQGFRRMAMQWHPDRCKEPDAHDRFIAIQDAYDLLRDSALRRKYDRGLLLEAQAVAVADPFPSTPATPLAAIGVGPYSWSPPQRAGFFLVAGRAGVRGFRATHILDVHDITDAQGCVLVSSWPADGDDFEELWADP